MRVQLFSLGSRKSGFTLIELMVVIVLMAILTAAIIPAMTGAYEDALLRSTARKLVDVCHLANSHAISINQVHRVRLDRINGRYFIERKPRHGEQGSGFIRDREVPGGAGPMDTRISIEVRNAEDSSDPMEPAELVRDEKRRSDVISFYADGTADSQEILLRDRQGFQLVLRINPITARVHIIQPGRQ